MTNKNSVDRNQNLIPAKLIANYLYQRTLVPAIIVIVVIFFGAGLLFVGINSLTESYSQKASELASQDLSVGISQLQGNLDEQTQIKNDLSNQLNEYWDTHPLDTFVDESRVNALKNQVERLKKELADLEATPDAPVTPEEASDKYHIEDLMLYIDKIRTQDVIIVSLEDSGSENANPSTGYLIYQNDLGKVSFSLHGMATSTQELDKFLKLLQNCEYVENSKIISIETKTFNGGQNLYVFEAIITPKVG